MKIAEFDLFESSSDREALIDTVLSLNDHGSDYPRDSTCLLYTSDAADE